MELERILEKKIVPKAEKIDREPKALWKGFRQLGKCKLLAQIGLNPEERFAFTELMQSYSGALGFFQRQHQAAGRLIANASQKEEWLRLMTKGKRGVGVSISHLRAPATPCVTAVQMEGGWSLKGSISWVSGYRLFDWLIVGFFCPEEGLEGMGLIRFKKGRHLKVSRVLPTIALASVQTVTIELCDLFLAEEHVVSLKPIGSYGKQSTALNVQFVNLSAVALGFLREVKAPKLREAYEMARATFLREGGSVELYAEMHRIATKLSHIARFSSGTRALICPNSVERRCRELMLFGVILPSKEISEACLRVL